MRHVRLDVTRDVAFEGQLEPHAARVIDEALPKHRARHKKLAPVETRRLEPRDVLAITRARSRQCTSMPGKPASVRIRIDPATPAPTTTMRMCRLSSRRAIGDRGDQTAAIRALGLGPAQYENSRVANHAGEAADRTPHVQLAFDVGMVKHGVPMPADVEAPLRLAFHQHGVQARPVLGENLQSRADAEITQHVHHGAKFESIAQRTLCNPQRSGPVAAVSEHDNLVRLDLNSR